VFLLVGAIATFRSHLPISRQRTLAQRRLCITSDVRSAHP
jgi:hypothetical protein